MRFRLYLLFCLISNDCIGTTNTNNLVSSGVIPSGMVTMWYGSLTNFDETGLGTNHNLIGWALCGDPAGEVPGSTKFWWVVRGDPIGTNIDLHGNFYRTLTQTNAMPGDSVTN